MNRTVKYLLVTFLSILLSNCGTPKSAVAEFNISELYKLLYYETQNVKFKEEALFHYRRTFEYYPGSVKESDAKTGYDELSSG